MPTIRILPDYLVNQIAAGEVIERPSAALKEIVENALDAGATAIDIALREGGKSYICVTDNGCGMSQHDLGLALTRHATSKLSTDDLVHINTMGFRGEALPSIGSVARLGITSRQTDTDTAWKIAVEGGRITPPAPASHPSGTRVEIRDLFYTTPARLKFLKADVTEYAACKDVIIRLSLARPDVAFTLTHNDTRAMTLPKNAGTAEEQLSSRVHDIMGAEFRDNTVALLADDRDIRFTGRIGYPTYNKGQSNHQYLFVNNRPVKDRLLLGALRAAYGDLMPRDRHAVCMIFITLPPEDVDINVHPAKSEVRFRDSGRIRGMMIAAIRQRLSLINNASSALSTPFTARITAANDVSAGLFAGSSYAPTNQSSSYLRDAAVGAYQPLFDTSPPPFMRDQTTGFTAKDSAQYPLGAAIAHIHDTYIIAQTHDGAVIVDAHAAHERLIYEEYKKQIGENGIPAQRLLSPEIVHLDDVRAAVLIQHAAELNTYGVEIDSFGPDCLLVRSVPSHLAERFDIPKIITDLADEVLEKGTVNALSDRILRFLSTRACHNAVRAGRPLNVDEMNALLRQIERTPNAQTCNHGRPTYVKMKLSDLENLFERG